MRDWIGFVITVVSFVLPFLGAMHLRRRHRQRERYRSFQGFGIKWTSYDRDDDRQS